MASAPTVSIPDTVLSILLLLWVCLSPTLGLEASLSSLPCPPLSHLSFLTPSCSPSSSSLLLSPPPPATLHPSMGARKSDRPAFTPRAAHKPCHPGHCPRLSQSSCGAGDPCGHMSLRPSSCFIQGRKSVDKELDEKYDIYTVSTCLLEQAHCWEVSLLLMTSQKV